MPSGIGGVQHGASVGDPEAFSERPGESMGGGGMGGMMKQLADIVDLIMPGVGLGGLILMFGSEMAKPGPLAEPGTYTLTLTIGGRTFTQQMTVERKGSFTGQNAPFEVEW